MAIEVVLVGLVLALEARFIQRLRREVRTLEGFIPICARCKKIREFGDWQPLESYLREHSMAEFSHGLCPECLGLLYPELAADDRLPAAHRTAEPRPGEQPSRRSRPSS